jgi:hypothetical protein
MAQLVHYADPVLIESHQKKDAQGKVVAIVTYEGDVIAVMPDDWVPSKDEAGHFVITRTDKPDAECVATYLAPGIPDELRRAEDDADRAMAAAQLAIEQADPKDDAALARARADLDAATAAFQDAQAQIAAREWPKRRCHVDLSVLPPEHVQSVLDYRAALDSVAAEAKATARAAFVAELQSIFGVVSPETLATPSKRIIDEFAERAAAAATPIRQALLDSIVDALGSASKAGRDLVEGRVKDAHEAPAPYFLDAQALDAATVVKP